MNSLQTDFSGFGTEEKYKSEEPFAAFIVGAELVFYILIDGNPRRWLTFAGEIQ